MMRPEREPGDLARQLWLEDLERARRAEAEAMRATLGRDEVFACHFCRTEYQPELGSCPRCHQSVVVTRRVEAPLLEAIPDPRSSYSVGVRPIQPPKPIEPPKLNAAAVMILSELLDADALTEAAEQCALPVLEQMVIDGCADAAQLHASIRQAVLDRQRGDRPMNRSEEIERLIEKYRE